MSLEEQYELMLYMDHISTVGANNQLEDSSSNHVGTPSTPLGGYSHCADASISQVSTRKPLSQVAI